MGESGNRKLGHVSFTEKDRSGFFRLLITVASLRGQIGQKAGAAGRPNATSPELVLHRHRHPVQRSQIIAAADGAFSLTGLSQC